MSTEAINFDLSLNGISVPLAKQLDRHSNEALKLPFSVN